jgi:hypothetical protein
MLALKPRRAIARTFALADSHLVFACFFLAARALEAAALARAIVVTRILSFPMATVCHKPGR